MNFLNIIYLMAIARKVTLSGSSFSVQVSDSLTLSDLATRPGPPTLSSASVDSDGLTLRLTFSRDVVHGAGAQQLDITTSFTTAGARTVIHSSTSGAVILYTLDRTINSGDTGTVSYTQPGNGIEAVDDGQDVASFSGQNVTNNSTVSVHLNSASIANASQPHTVTVVWAENKTQGTGWSGSDITLTIYDGSTTTEGLGLTYVSGSGTGTWIFEYLSTRTSSDVFKLSFNGAADSVEDSVGADTPAFTNRPVTNNIP